MSWGYDDQLRLDAETVEGDTVAYGYDSFGRLTSMGAMTAAYDSTTDLLSSTTLGTVETTFFYSGFGDLSGILYEAGNDPFYGVSYTRDAFGRVAMKTETRPSGSTLRCYEYDDSDRLAAVYDGADSNGCVGTQLEAYTYDLNGNRTSVTNSAGTVPVGDIVTDGQDRLMRHGDFAYTYNEDGQMTSRTQLSSGDVWTYVYDAVGNLREVDPPGIGGTITYITDPRNRRVGKRVDGLLVQGFLYGDQLNPVAELDGSGAVVSRFVYGTSDHVPDYMVRGGVTYRFVTDQLGSVVGVYDLSGAVVQTREYDAYGRIVFEDTQPGFSQPFGFAGGLWDADTGLVRFGARDYRPEVGSWAAKDPLRFEAGDGALFAYSFSDPVNYIDATGLAPVDGMLGTISDAVSGFGDTVSFGLTGVVRKGLGIDDVVDRCSGAYVGAEIAGVLHGLAFGGAHLGRNVLRQTTRTRSGLRRLFFDNRTWNTVRRTWSGVPPILKRRGQHLHHWLIPQRWRWVPQGIRNAGFNYMPLSSGFNSWMNGTTFARSAVEWGLKGVVFGTYAAPATASISRASCGCG